MFRKLSVSFGRIAARLHAVINLSIFSICGFAWVAPGLLAQTEPVYYSGVQTTVHDTTGSGLLPSGVAVDGNGSVYISYYFSGDVVQLSPTGNGDYGAAVTVASGLNHPYGLAIDQSGNIFIALSGDQTSGNGTVVKATPVGNGSWTTPTTVVSGLTLPKGIAVDGSGNLYIADSGNFAVKKVLLTSGNYGTPSTIADTSTNSSTFVPYGVAVDGSGNVFVADQGNSSNNGTIVEIPAGCAAANCQILLDSGMHQPQGIAVDASGNLLIADNGFGWMLELPWTGSGYSSVHLPLFNQGLLRNQSKYLPTSVAVDRSGNIYYTDTNTYKRVEKGSIKAVDFGTVNVGSHSATIPVSFVFIVDNSTIGSWAVLTHGVTSLDFSDAQSGTCSTSSTYNENDGCTVDVTFTPQSSGLRSGAVVLKDASGNVIATAYLNGIGLAPQIAFSPGSQTTVVSSGLTSAAGVAVDGNGNVYIADSASGNVIKSSNGTQSTVGSGLSSPSDMAVDGSGNIYIADTGNQQIVKVPWTGTSYGAQTAVISGLTVPRGVAVDGDGNLYIADSGSRSVVKLPWIASGYEAQLTIADTTTNGSSFVPVDVTVDSSRNVYIVDSGNNQVVKVPWSGSSYGTQSTVGSGLSSPVGVAVDGAGNIYVADSGSHKVVEVTWTGSSYGTQSTIADSTTNGIAFLPTGVAVGVNGNIYIADSGNNQVVEVDVADPPSLDFASTPVGSTSSDSPKTVVVSNIGNMPLVFATTGSGNPLYTTNFPEYLSDSNLCATGTTLSLGASCDVSANFTPLTAGSFNEQIVLTNNALNVSSTQSIGVHGTGKLALLPGSLSAGSVGVAYSETFTATGGSGTYLFSVSGGTLPSGLNLSTSGLLSGTPIAGGNFSITITATDSNTQTIAGTQIYSLNIGAATITLLPSSLPDATYGSSYSQTLTAAGGTSSYSYAVTSGALPTGLALSTSGTLSGTPAAGSFTFTIMATDSSTGTGPYSGSRAYSLTVNAATPTLSLACSEVTYDGALHSCIGTATGIGGSAVSGSWSYSPASAINAGSTSIIATFTSSNANYTSGGTASGTLKINTATPTLALTCTKVTYDSNAHSCVGAATGIGGTAIDGTWSYTPASATSVGSAAVTGTFTSSNTNYTSGGIANGTLEIDVATPTLALTCPKVTYDGNAHSCVGTATGVGGTSIAGTWSYTPVSATTAGNPLVTGTFTSSNTNYTSGGITNGVLQIGVATPTLALTCLEVTYDGNAHTCIGTATGVGGTAITGTWSYIPASATSVGSTPVTGTFTSSNANYASGGAASGTLIIDALAPSLTGVYPAFTSASGTAFVLSVNGSGFTSGSTAYWGTSALITHYLSSTQLTAQVTASDITFAGINAITVQTPSPGGGTSNTLQFEVDTAGSEATAPVITTTAATVTAGSTASYPVTFPSTVTSASLTCLNLPSGAACNYSSSAGTVTITTSSTTPTGTYQITLVFTETVSGSSAAGILLPILLLPLVFLRRKLTARGMWLNACLGLVLMTALAFSTGCVGKVSTSSANTAHQVTSSGVVNLTIR